MNKEEGEDEVIMELYDKRSGRFRDDLPASFPANSIMISGPPG